VVEKQVKIITLKMAESEFNKLMEVLSVEITKTGHHISVNQLLLDMVNREINLVLSDIPGIPVTIQLPATKEE